MKEEEIYNEAVEQWRSRGGYGTFFITKPLDTLRPLLILLPQLYNRSPTCSTLIIVDDFKARNEVIDYLTTTTNEVYNQVFASLINTGKIKILSTNYVGDNINHFNPLLTVVYKPISFTFVHLGIFEKSKFKLAIITSYLGENSMNNFYTVCPLIDVFKQNVLDEIRTSRPVKDVRIGISIDTNSREYKQLEYYNKEIATTINIFGDFKRIETARLGDKSTNISAMAICNEIANSNGWTPDLDMSIQYNVEIDCLYNPNALKERASKTYEYIRKRSRLIANYNKKLDSIVELIENNPDKRFLIISKYGDFASKVTDSLNMLHKYNTCGNHHDKVDSIPAIDKDGNAIYYKSGAKKGERKLMGVTAQKKLSQQLFNMGKIRVLSCSNLPDKDLDINVDIVIITSSLCEPIETYLYRLANVKFANNLDVYTLYCKGTLEEKRLDEIKSSPTHVIVNNSVTNVNIENNSDIIIVD